MTTIRIAVEGGTMEAYLTTPAAGTGPGTGPALVLIQEIFGVNHVMRDLAAFFSAEGFLCLVPDLFWRLQPGIRLTDRSPEEWQQALSLMTRFDADAGIADLAGTIAAARALEGATGRVGAVGYCLGGRLAYQVAARTDVDAAVGYYGVGIETLLDEAPAIGHPLLLHIATKDAYVPRAAQQRIHAALDADPFVTLHDYVGRDHAFARIGGQHYDKPAADLANERTIAFLKRHLL